MRNINYVSLEDLKKVYGEQIQMVNKLDSPGNVDVLNTTLLTEKIEVEILSSMGPYTVISILNVKGSVDRLIVPKEIIKQDTVPYAIDQFIPILDRLHKDSYWYDRSNNYLYINYPEIEIRNSMGQSHTIHDLTVKIKVNRDTGSLSPDHLYGKRFSLSPEEIEVGYCHSHLSSDCWDFSNRFCQGGSSPFRLLVEGLNKVVSPDEFELFILQLKEYVSWESLEGSPYISMEDVIGGSSNSGYAGYDLDSGLQKTVTNFILEALKEKTSLVVQMGDMIIFDPTLDDEAFYSIEREIIDTMPLSSNNLVDWYEPELRYLSSGRASSLNPSRYDINDYVDSSYMNIAAHLNVEPRIITPTKRPQEKVTVKRLGVNCITQLVSSVNARLVVGLNKAVNAKRVQIKEESNSNSNGQTGSTNPVYA